MGELGYEFDGHSLSFVEEVKAEYLQNFSRTFIVPKTFKKLETFVDIYSKFVREHNLIDDKIILEGVKNIPRDHFPTYVSSLPQYIEAKEAGKDKFDFRAPMIILEGMCLLDNIILPECFK